MAEASDGSVSRQSVIAVMVAMASICGFSIKIDDAMVTVVCNGVPEIYMLPDPVGRRLISRFVHKYKVRVEYFYHPQMIPQLEGTKN